MAVRWFFPVLVLILLPGGAGASEVEISGVSFVQETVRGRWTIEARSAVFREGEGVILDSVSARMASGDGGELSVTSRRGRYDSERLVLFLEGEVLAHQADGFDLRAPEVTWDGPGATLEAREGVEMEGKAIFVRGNAARYSIDTRTILFTGAVRTVLRPGGALP